jgi:ATP-dependent protease HslVU (ClpYQ) peptidase subunit
VSYESDGKVFLGGDSYLTYEAGYFATIDELKVYKIANIGVGVCGSVAAEQVLEKEIKKFAKNNKKITFSLFKDKFVPIFKSKIKSEDLMLATPNGGCMPPGAFIFAIEGKSYILEDDFSIWASSDCYAAVGAGAIPAKGAMEILKNIQDLTPEQKVLKALEVSAQISEQVKPPFTVIKI